MLAACGSLMARARAATCCCVAKRACLSSLVPVEMPEMLSCNTLVLALFAICIWAREPAMLPRLLSSSSARAIAAPWYPAVAAVGPLSRRAS